RGTEADVPVVPEIPQGIPEDVEQKKEILVLIWERIVDVKIPGRQGAARYFSILLMALFWSLRFWH
ncbi:MAG: hypothetical protein PUI73_04710, partial [bacterium]|nr:hypothetical protein [bacterium]MDY5457057.1 hypothetical protein [Bariatricus sp.]